MKGAFALVALAFVIGNTAHAQCCGDCDRNGAVAVNELVTAVNYLLEMGETPCEDADVCGRIGVELTQCNANLTTCNTNFTTCSANLVTCTEERDGCNEDITTCRTERNRCVNVDLPGCQTNLASTQTSLTECQEDLVRCEAQCDGQLFPATGQTTCWDSNGNVIACIGTGQDGEFRTGAALAYVNNGDGTITDLNTRLMWEVKDDSGGLHDQDTTPTWDGALAFVRGLNTAGFAGHTNWRLPSVKELQSIQNFERSPAVTSAFDTACIAGCTLTSCSCTPIDPPYYFWSSTSYASGSEQAWGVDYSSGDALHINKGTGLYVRAVRGGL